MDEEDEFELEQETAFDWSDSVLDAEGEAAGIAFAEAQDNDTDMPDAFGGWDDSLEDGV